MEHVECGNPVNGTPAWCETALLDPPTLLVDCRSVTKCDVLNVLTVTDPPRDTGGIEVSHYLLQVDSGSGVYCSHCVYFCEQESGEMGEQIEIYLACRSHYVSYGLAWVSPGWI